MGNNYSPIIPFDEIIKIHEESIGLFINYIEKNNFKLNY